MLKNIPIGATHLGCASGNYYKLVGGEAFKWCRGKWGESTRSRTLLNGTGVTDNPNGGRGYYKIPLEDIMESFIEGQPKGEDYALTA